MSEKAKPVIRAGRVEEIQVGSGEWVFVDMGFSAKRASCGYLRSIDLRPKDKATCLTFGGVRKNLCELVKRGEGSLNLVLEAPLSVAFDRTGNPVGRKCEKWDKQEEKGENQPSGTRYWYVPLGCGVLVPALYLLRAITDASRTREVRLFEAFVSFKEKGVKSDHVKDINALRDLVKARGGSTPAGTFDGSVLGPDELAVEGSTLESAFKVAGLDYGIPPILFVVHKRTQGGEAAMSQGKASVEGSKKAGTRPPRP